MTGQVLLTGAGGFIGGHTARKLDGSGFAVRGLVRSGSGGAYAAERRVGDLEDPASLRGCCAGVDAIVHTASYAGADEERSDRVNALGTEALLREADRAGVERVVYVSTAAVYGDGVHTNAAEHELPADPVPPAGRARLRAEQAVLSRGGIVLRPLFVYGDGDRWFVPGMVKMAQKLPFLVDRGRARLSVVSVDDLAAVIVALLARPVEGPATFHVDDTEPPSVRDILGVVSRHLGVAVPRDNLPGSLAPLVHATASRSWQRQLHLVSVDHYYDSSRVWSATRLTPGGSLSRQFAAYAPWYRDSLSATPPVAESA